MNERFSLADLLHKRAQLNADKQATFDHESGRRMTYRELSEATHRTANALNKLGIKQGDRLALLLCNSVDYIQIYLAAAQLGAICVPINIRLAAKEVAYILNDSGSQTLIFDTEFDAVVTALLGEETPLNRLACRQISAVEKPDLVNNFSQTMQEASTEPIRIEQDPDSPVLIMYTSGTTGFPKGVVHTHDTVRWACITYNMSVDNRVDDRYLQVMPMFHIAAFTTSLAIIHRGGALVVLKVFEPQQLVQIMADERCTSTLLVPTMLQMILPPLEAGDVDYSALRWIMCGAAPVPVPLIEKAGELGVNVLQVYGSTETCGPACVIDGHEAMRRIGSTGPAFYHTDVRVVDEGGLDVGAGEQGEILVSAAHVFKEYWNNPSTTADSFVDGWFRTGDIAEIDADGYLTICDRKKDMIISGGENIYPAEIESCLMGHESIHDCAVIGKPSEKWGEVPLAIIACNNESPVSLDDLQQWCDGRLARYKIPRAVEQVHEIPRNVSGKILKVALRERFIDDAK